jgi:hypothetical protein
MTGDEVEGELSGHNGVRVGAAEASQNQPRWARTRVDISDDPNMRSKKTGKGYEKRETK